MLRHAGRNTFQHSIFADRRKLLFRLILVLACKRSSETLLDVLPAVLRNGLALGFELIALTENGDLRLIVDILLTGSSQKPHTDQREDFLLGLRQLRDVLLFKLDGGDNGVMIRDLGVVGHTPDVRLMGEFSKHRQFPADNGDDLMGGSFHIIGDKLAVRAGIGQQLLFIEGLHEIERLLSGKAEIAVCLPLQGGQIVELRGIDRLRLSPDRRNDGLLFITSRRDGLCLIL